MSRIGQAARRRMNRASGTGDPSPSPQYGGSISLPTPEEQQAHIDKRVFKAKYGKYNYGTGLYEGGTEQGIQEAARQKEQLKARRQKLKDELELNKYALEVRKQTEIERANKAKETQGTWGVGEKETPSAPLTSGAAINPSTDTATRKEMPITGQTPSAAITPAGQNAQSTIPTQVNAQTEQEKWTGPGTGSITVHEPELPKRTPYTLENQDPIGNEGDTYSNKWTGFQPRKMGPPDVPPTEPVPVRDPRIKPAGTYWMSNLGNRRYTRPGEDPDAYAPSSITEPAKVGGVSQAPPPSPVDIKKEQARKSIPMANSSPNFNPAFETAKDMLYRAPVNAIGRENLGAAAETAIDMAYRAPLNAILGVSQSMNQDLLNRAGKNAKTISEDQKAIWLEEAKKKLQKVWQGMEWLSKYALGGVK